MHTNDLQIKNMIVRQLARKLNDIEIENYDGPVHYLLRHEVLKPDLKTTILMIVSNSSASFMRHTLND